MSAIPSISPSVTPIPATFARPAVAGTPGAPFRLLGACYRWIAGYFVRRDAIAWLRECDDAALRDIGLARSEIEGAVRGLVSPSGGARRG
ncbi:DUF1127 domain-containing protein [Bosea sp. 2YAB26]|uniref:DUF1127 domain-containing protein n=1 Tax=Bosea sp. 2YAB26 TaxID=3237478 RepID=UPI003F92C8E8